MKKFIFLSVVFISIYVIFDFVFGYANRYMQTNANNGLTESQEYIATHSKDDIIILGASCAKHHYVSDMFKDSLQLTCYNCGEDGNGIIMNYGYFKLLTSRYTPKTIIYDFSSVVDIYEYDNQTFLGYLRKYYGQPDIDSILESVDKTERYKNMSNLYRYNTRWATTFYDFMFSNTDIVGNGGYVAYNGTMNYEVIPEEKEEEPTDSLKVFYLEKLISDCKSLGVNLVFIISPSYGASPNSTYNEPIKRLCKKEDVKLLDYYSDERFVHNKTFFYNSTHLNDAGAKYFTSIVISEIKSLVSQ